MTWYGHHPNAAQKEAEAKRRAELLDRKRLEEEREKAHDLYGAKARIEPFQHPRRRK